MKRLLSLILPLLLVTLWGCDSDQPDPDAKGLLTVHLEQEGDSDVDFSEYSVAIVPEQGFVPSAPIKDIEWPVEVYVGTYTIAAASPKIEENETSESYYYGEVKNVTIAKDRTTEITVPLKLTVFQKSEI